MHHRYNQTELASFLLFNLLIYAHYTHSKIRECTKIERKIRKGKNRLKNGMVVLLSLFPSSEHRQPPVLPLPPLSDLEKTKLATHHRKTHQNQPLWSIPMKTDGHHHQLTRIRPFQVDSGSNSQAKCRHKCRPFFSSKNLSEIPPKLTKLAVTTQNSSIPSRHPDLSTNSIPTPSFF